MNRRVWLAFFTVIIAWGASYLFIRLAISSWTPFGLVATRCGLAALICAGLAVIRREALPSGSRLARFALVGVLMMSGSNALTSFAQKTVGSGVTGVVHSLGSVWLAAMGSFGWWGPSSPRTPARAWLGVVGGVAGVLVLLWPSNDSARVETTGFGALVLATLIFALATLIQKRAQPSFGQAAPPSSSLSKPVPSMPSLFSQLSMQMAAGSAMSAVLAVATGMGFMHSPPTVTSLGAVVFLTVISSVAGFAAYAVVLHDWPAARAGSFSVLNPCVSVLLGVLILDEPLTSRMLFGVVVTLLSVVWVQRVSAE